MRGESKPKTCNCICNLNRPQDQFLCHFISIFARLNCITRLKEKIHSYNFSLAASRPRSNNFKIEFLNAINLCRQNVCGELLNSSASTAHRGLLFLNSSFYMRAWNRILKFSIRLQKKIISRKYITKYISISRINQINGVVVVRIITDNRSTKACLEWKAFN